MTSDTVRTQVYDTRLPAPSVIRGALALHDPGHFDLSSLTPGYELTAEFFDLPRQPEPPTNSPGVGDSWEFGTYDDKFTVQDVMFASSIRAYVLLPTGHWMGWWRIDVQTVREPDRAEILGELTPLTDVGSLIAVQTSDLRVDDLMYVSGLPDGHVYTRILDVTFRSDDGRGEYALVRTVYGWFCWRRSFAHVAEL